MDPVTEVERDDPDLEQDEADTEHDIEEDVLVEEISIDGMCGVY